MTEYKTSIVAGVECAWVPTGTEMSDEIRDLSKGINGVRSICGLCPAQSRPACAATTCAGFILVESKYIPILRMRSKPTT